jgi:hypothetical protein
MRAVIRGSAVNQLLHQALKLSNPRLQRLLAWRQLFCADWQRGQQENQT